MTREYLQDWYNSNDISYSEKERLNKMGLVIYPKDWCRIS